jgi:ABC-2 type transport system ATP-binding protein
MAPAAIETRRLSKDYGQERGLFDCDLRVEPGEIFGFLGPNGAGKTTLIRLLMGMIRPTRGSATIFGLDCQMEAVPIKRLTGYIPGELPQFGGLRGNEIVAYLAGLRGGVDPARVRAIAERFDLDLGRKFREYSRGNKQKLGILIAFMARPRLLVLDEPTSGLDPLNQQTFYQLVREARAESATVFLSSHILSEVEHVCDRVGIVRRGRLVRVAELEDLHRIRVHHVEIEFGGTPPVARIRAAAGVERVTVQGNRISCTVRGSFEALMQAIAGEPVLSLSSAEPSLEEVFLAYYQEDAGREDPGGEASPGDQSTPNAAAG